MGCCTYRYIHCQRERETVSPYLVFNLGKKMHPFPSSSVAKTKSKLTPKAPTDCAVIKSKLFCLEGEEGGFVGHDLALALACAKGGETQTSRE